MVGLTIVALLAAVVWLPALGGTDAVLRSWRGAVGVILAGVGCLIVGAAVWQCPRCGAQFGGRLAVDVCPECRLRFHEPLRPDRELE